MIQEKDFLYRVPVKTAPITTPRGQIRNPEILVDLEGGEFMRGNILDANSTNKLINQSVKDAVDDKFIGSGYVTKDLLDAETSARTKGDEDLHTALNQAITEKADASALANEVSRATGAESGLQAAIATKADATALSNYVLTTALNKQVDTLNTAIGAKQDAGNYIPYDSTDASNYKVDRTIKVSSEIGYTTLDFGHIVLSDNNASDLSLTVGVMTIDSAGIRSDVGDGFMLNDTGITFMGRPSQQIPTAGGDFINISDLASAEDISSLRVGLSKKQDKITVNKVDVTDIETADITKLRTIVTNLINALSASNLIIETSSLE